MVFVQNRDPEATYLLVRVVGGEVPGASFSQKLGFYKIPAKTVTDKVKNLTGKDFTQQKVHVLLEVKDRNVVCEVYPSTAQALIRELKEVREARKKGAEKAPRPHNGSLSLNALFKVAGECRPRSRARTMRGTVKEVLGTARSLGCMIEGKSPAEATCAVSNGRRAVAELFGIEDESTLPAFLDD